MGDGSAPRADREGREKHRGTDRLYDEYEAVRDVRRLFDTTDEIARRGKGGLRVLVVVVEGEGEERLVHLHGDPVMLRGCLLSGMHKRILQPAPVHIQVQKICVHVPLMSVPASEEDTVEQLRQDVHDALKAWHFPSSNVFGPSMSSPPWWDEGLPYSHKAATQMTDETCRRILGNAHRCVHSDIIKEGLELKAVDSGYVPDRVQYHNPVSVLHRTQYISSYRSAKPKTKKTFGTASTKCKDGGKTTLPLLRGDTQRVVGSFDGMPQLLPYTEPPSRSNVEGDDEISNADRHRFDALVEWMKSLRCTTSALNDRTMRNCRAFAEVLHHIDSSFFSQDWLEQIREYEIESNWRDKANNLRQVLCRVTEFYSEVLHRDVANSARWKVNEQKFVDVVNGDLSHMCTLIYLLIGAAFLNDAIRSKFIDLLKLLPHIVQQTVMSACAEMKEHSKQLNADLKSKKQVMRVSDFKEALQHPTATYSGQPRAITDKGFSTLPLTNAYTRKRQRQQCADMMRQQGDVRKKKKDEDASPLPQEAEEDAERDNRTTPPPASPMQIRGGIRVHSLDQSLSSFGGQLLFSSQNGVFVQPSSVGHRTQPGVAAPGRNTAVASHVPAGQLTRSNVAAPGRNTAVASHVPAGQLTRSNVATPGRSTTVPAHVPAGSASRVRFVLGMRQCRPVSTTTCPSFPHASSRDPPRTPSPPSDKWEEMNDNIHKNYITTLISEAQKTSKIEQQQSDIMAERLTLKLRSLYDSQTTMGIVSGESVRDTDSNAIACEPPRMGSAQLADEREVDNVLSD